VKQTTLQRPATLSGIALHTGNRVAIVLHPAPVDTGIQFRRTDVPSKPMVAARIENVVDVQRGTTIADGDARVHTVEHLLAALYTRGVTNAIVDMAGPEPPVGDGSSTPFLEMIDRAGVQPQGAEAPDIGVDRPLVLELGETRMVMVPDPEFRISCTVKYGSTTLFCQYLSLQVTCETFERELSRARTFCLYEEIEALMKANLIVGGSLDNAVVIKDDVVLSKEGLRYADEFVRHKMLDIVGDLSLLGARIRGHVIAVKPGHPSNVALARMIREENGD